MNRSRLLFGAAVVALGTVFLLEALDVVANGGDIVATWWPTVLIAAALLMLPTSHWMTPAAVGGVGVLLLLATTDVLDLSSEAIWPIVLIVIGLSLLVRTRSPKSVSDDRVNAFAAFGGTEMASHSSHFEGGSIGAVFGGAEIDLRDASLAENAHLDVFTAFGGTEIRVPNGWKVITRGLPLFGGFENITTKEQLPENAPVLDITATVLFGGLEVKH